MNDVTVKMNLSRKLTALKNNGHADIESVIRAIVFNSGIIIDWQFVQRELDRAFPERAPL